MRNFKAKYNCGLLVALCLFAIAGLTCRAAEEVAAQKPAEKPIEKPAEKAPVKITYKTEKDVAYYSDAVLEKADEYQKAQCRLDLLLPENNPGFATIIWIHGGGLTGGKKSIPGNFGNKGYGVVGVEYRLWPKVKCPAYLEDAAAAVAWVYKNIERYGGDPKKIFITGHSAGGYLTAMLALDPRWLEPHKLKAQEFAGFAPLSGMMTTHFHIRSERGDKQGNQLLVDDFSPIRHVKPDTAPILLITGDRELEWPGRVEENLLLARMLKVAKHNDVTMYELQGYGHGMTTPAFPLVLSWIEKQLKKSTPAKP